MRYGQVVLFSIILAISSLLAGIFSQKFGLGSQESVMALVVSVISLVFLLVFTSSLTRFEWHAGADTVWGHLPELLDSGEVAFLAACTLISAEDKGVYLGKHLRAYLTCELLFLRDRELAQALLDLNSFDCDSTELLRIDEHLRKVAAGGG